MAIVVYRDQYGKRTVSQNTGSNTYYSDKYNLLSKKENKNKTVVAGFPELDAGQVEQVKVLQEESIRNTGSNIVLTRTSKGVVANQGEQIKPRVVVTGRPELSNETATNILNYSKEIRGRVELKNQGKKIIVSPSSEDALRLRMKYANDLKKQGFNTAGEVLNTPSSSSSPAVTLNTYTAVNKNQGAYYDSIKTTPLEPVYRFGNMLDTKAKIEEQNAFLNNGFATSEGTSSTFKGIGFSLGAKSVKTGLFVLDIPRRVVNFVKDPVTQTEAGVMFVADVGKDPFKYGYQFGEKLQNQPIQTGSNLVFDFGVYPVAVTKTGQFIRDTSVRAVATEIPATKVFNPEVLAKVEAGETAFPLTKSPMETLAKFEATRTAEGLKVVSASPQPITTLGQSRIVKIGEGQSSDIGFFTTPYGEGSPYFLKVSNKYELPSEPPTFGLIPKISRPTVSQVTGIKSIIRVPGGVLSRGVEATRTYVRGLKGTGKIFVTRGSEASYNPRLKYDPVSKKTTFATGELEANIPPGNYILTDIKGGKNVFGYNEYVTVNNRPVPIREYKLTSITGETKIKTLDTDGLTSSSYGGGSSKITPVSYPGSIKYSNAGSSTSSKGVLSTSNIIGGSSSRAGSSYSKSYPSRSYSAVSRSNVSYPKSITSSPVSYPSRSSSRVSRAFSEPVSIPVSEPVSYSPPKSYPSYKPRSPSRSGYSYPPITPIKYPTKFKLSGKSSKNIGGFISQVRKKGKFINLGTFKTSAEAFRRANIEVSNTASASLRVKELGTGRIVLPTGLIGKQFRSSNKEAGVVIERRRFRIKSSGEKQEITYKGIMVQKNKSIFRGLKI